MSPRVRRPRSVPGRTTPCTEMLATGLTEETETTGGRIQHRNRHLCWTCRSWLHQRQKMMTEAEIGRESEIGTGIETGTGRESEAETGTETETDHHTENGQTRGTETRTATFLTETKSGSVVARGITNAPGTTTENAIAGDRVASKHVTLRTVMIGRREMRIDQSGTRDRRGRMTGLQDLIQCRTGALPRKGYWGMPHPASCHKRQPHRGFHLLGMSHPGGCPRPSIAGPLQMYSQGLLHRTSGPHPRTGVPRPQTPGGLHWSWTGSLDAAHRETETTAGLTGRTAATRGRSGGTPGRGGLLPRTTPCRRAGATATTSRARVRPGTSETTGGRGARRRPGLLCWRTLPWNPRTGTMTLVRRTGELRTT